MPNLNEVFDNNTDGCAVVLVSGGSSCIAICKNIYVLSGKNINFHNILCELCTLEIDTCHNISNNFS